MQDIDLDDIQARATEMAALATAADGTSTVHLAPGIVIKLVELARFGLARPDERYETLKGQYNAIVTERDALQETMARSTGDEIARLKNEIKRLTGPREACGIFCDAKCGKAIMGESEEIVRAYADSKGWLQSHHGRELCDECRARSK